MGFKKQGFTLVELVIAIIVLGIIGTATTAYIATGVSLYSDISERDRELNSVRFAMERLRRDILNALPNSLLVEDIIDSNSDTNVGRCLTFTPIINSSIYNYDFPIAPMSKISASIATLENYTYNDNHKVAVYVLDAAELQDANINTAQVHEISSIVGEVITFKGLASFPLGSPSKRLYIIGKARSYYFNSAKQLILSDSCTENGSLMANDIQGSFTVAKASLQRNGLAKVTFTLTFDDQEVPIEQTLHVTNVP